MSVSEFDLLLVKGDFLKKKYPVSDNNFLLRHFRSDNDRLFIIYYMTFAELGIHKNRFIFYQSFMDHTGVKCAWGTFNYLYDKLMWILEDFSKAQKNFDFSKIEEIKKAKVEYGKKKKKN